jgi:hypothetical protein
LPPKAKITAEVCNGRSRPKLVHGSDGRDPDRAVHVILGRIAQRIARLVAERALQHEHCRNQTGEQEQQPVEGHAGITRCNQQRKADGRTHQRANQRHGVRKRGPLLNPPYSHCA